MCGETGDRAAVMASDPFEQIGDLGDESALLEQRLERAARLFDVSELEPERGHAPSTLASLGPRRTRGTLAEERDEVFLAPLAFVEPLERRRERGVLRPQ